MTPLLASWQVCCAANDSALITPDGCRDIVLVRPAKGPPRWFLSPLTDQTYSVALSAGDHYSGFRLRPGTLVDGDGLGAALHGHTGDDVQSRLADHCTLPEATQDILACLETLPHGSAEAARALGVSVRTLQRTTLRLTGCSPLYWLHLARVRKAGRAVCSGGALAEVALDHGYADQAHMSRAFRHWFGLSPTALRADTQRRQHLEEAGYG